jgi:hypothetical protein
MAIPSQLFFNQNFVFLKFQNATSTTFVVPRSQEIAIVYLPVVFLALFLPVDVIFICRSRYRSIPWNTLSVSKIVLTLVLSAVTCVVLSGDTHHSTADWMNLVCYVSYSL